MIKYIWLIDETLTGFATSGEIELESTDNEGVIHILPNSRIEALSSDGLG